MTRFAFLLALGAVFASCGRLSQVNGSYGTCEMSGTSQCEDYTGSDFAVATDASRACTAANVFPSMNYVYTPSAACPTADRVGSCTENGGTSSETVTRYYSTGASAFTLSNAQANCSDVAGQFTAN